MKATMPKLEIGKYLVVFTEKATGIILTTQNQYYLGEGEFYKVFNSENEANDFAAAYVKLNPNIECSVRDNEGNHIRFI